MYYPTHIADDESDLESSCSAEIEGSYLPQHLDNGTPSRSSISENKKQYPWEKREEYGLAVPEDFDDTSANRRQHNVSSSPPKSRSVVDQQTNQMAELIKNERNRRLGVSVNSESFNKSEEDIIPSAERAPSGLLGNIKGWFGGGNLNQSDRSNLNNSQRSLSHSARSLNNEQPAQIDGSRRESVQKTIHEDKAYTDDDSSTSSSSSSSCSSISQHSSLDQRTRARHQALRYLSNSCVDAGRKSKTLSYIWGLERLDLKRRRDRFERELGVVEGEMNKDFVSNSGDDKVAKLAGRLVRELPRLSLSSGADAGAGSDKGKTSTNKAYMTLEEYVDVIQSLDPDISIDFEENEKNHPSEHLWTNQGALEKYLTHLQARLRDAMERTKSLEKRLTVLEKAGDDVVGSLCEDLVDVTSHSNKAEARYVKKGKELERKRRRLEMTFRTKIKELEKKVNLLEEGILIRSGSNVTTYLNDDISDSDVDEEDEEDDEIRLEKKLSDIKAKTEQEKVEHELSVQSIRRQCEQSKLKLSVAKLVMAGDDNLREYISALERFDPIKQHRMQRRASDQFVDEDEVPPEALPPPPPSKVTRARAKLLKAMHIERIYEHRLAVSKAFNDAAINALEQELADRETSGQQMEVRCLNELMVIDTEIKDITAKGEKKLESLQKEVRELKDAMSAVSSNDALLGGDEAAAIQEQLNNFEFNPSSAVSTDNGSTSAGSNTDTADSDRIDSSETSDNRRRDAPKANDATAPNTTGDSPIKATSESDNASLSSKQTNKFEDEAHVGDDNLNTSLEMNAKPDDTKSSVDLSTDQVHKSPKAQEKSQPGHDQNNKTKQLSGEQKEKILQILGLELKCTLAEYQTSIGLSSSSDRVEQINYMNQVVLKISEVSGIDMSKSEVEGGIQSWSHSLVESKRTPKDKERKRSKKRASKLKRRKSKRKSTVDDNGFDENDRLFLASLTSAKFNDSTKL